MLDRIVWLSELSTVLSLIVRVQCSDSLRPRYQWLSLWLLAVAGRMVALELVPWRWQSWEWSQAWAYTLWPVLALQIAATVEIIRARIRQYGPRNRKVGNSISAVLAMIGAVITAASACVLEANVITWEPPIRVQFAIGAERIAYLVCALSIIATVFVLSRLRRIPVCPNHRIISIVLPAWLVAYASVAYLNLALWPDGTHLLNNLFMARACASILAFSVLAIALRSSGEWDCEQPDLSDEEKADTLATEAASGYTAMARRELLRAMRGFRVRAF